MRASPRRALLTVDWLQPQAAAGHFDKAMHLSPNYFASYLGAGIVQTQLGNKDKE